MSTYQTISHLRRSNSSSIRASPNKQTDPAYLSYLEL